MFDINEILEPETLEEALELLDKNKELKIIAGGTDVLIKLHHNKMKDAELLSLRKINGLDEINMLEDESIEVGAMASFSKIFRDEIVQKHIKILAEGAVSMGDHKLEIWLPLVETFVMVLFQQTVHQHYFH